MGCAANVKKVIILQKKKLWGGPFYTEVFIYSDKISLYKESVSSVSP